MNISDIYTLTLHGVPLDEIPMTLEQEKMIIEFRKYENINKISEVYKQCQIPKTWIRVLFKTKHGMMIRHKTCQIRGERNIRYSYDGKEFIVIYRGLNVVKITNDDLPRLLNLSYSQAFDEAKKIGYTDKYFSALPIFLKAFKEGRVISEIPCN